MSPSETHDILRRAIARHGHALQVAKAAEEFSELAAATLRFAFFHGTLDDVAEEAADALIMLEQLELMAPGLNALIVKHRAAKLERLAERLEVNHG